MMSDNCIACQTEKHFLGKANGLIIDVCPNCGLGETRGKSRLQYHDYHRDTDYKLNQNQFKNIFQKRVTLITKFKKSGKILEIGSSIGLLLSLFQEKGFIVQGIEPSKNAANTALKNNIPTYASTFEKAKLKSNDFDVVILNHVLEHLQDPVEALRKVRKILKKNGLVLVDIPNFGGIKARMIGASWEYVLPKEHKWHFTRDSLERILKSLGFEVIYTETRSGIWDYSNPAKELFSSFFGFKKRFFSESFFALPDFIVSRFGLGSGLTVIGKKEALGK